MSKNKIFGSYSEYYDLLYQDKDYLSETDYINNLIIENSSHPKTILDLGCGTGRHDLLLKDKGYKITGVDFSENMVEIANKSIPKDNDDIRFLVGDIRDLKLEKKFDTIISLFHVASYQTTNNDIKAFIETAYSHLESGGVFIFDFWYGPAVLNDNPTFRYKTFENENLKIRRFTKPKIFPNFNTVEVSFETLVQNKKTDQIKEIFEIHNMRYFFYPELEWFLNQTGFTIKKSYKWMSKQPLGSSSWYGVIVAQK